MNFERLNTLLLYYVNIYNIKTKHRVYGVVTMITNITSKT